MSPPYLSPKARGQTWALNILECAQYCNFTPYMTLGAPVIICQDSNHIGGSVLVFSSIVLVIYIYLA